MAQFELHVLRNGDWNRLDSFEDRGMAMSAAVQIETSRRFPALKILREDYDEAQRTFKTKLIHKWSEDAERKARDKEVDQNLERQRLERKKIRRTKQARHESWSTKMQNYLVITGTAVTAIAGTIALMFVMQRF